MAAAHDYLRGMMPHGAEALDAPYSPKRRGSAAALHVSPTRAASPGRAPLVHGRPLADIPPPSWPPRLDFRYLGYGEAGPYVPREEADLAHRFDGFEDHTYAPGPPIGGGGYVFGTAAAAAGARGEPPRSRNRLRLASGGGGLDGGSEAVHPDCDPNVPDDGPGPGEYSTPRWPEGPGFGGRGTTFFRGADDRRGARGGGGGARVGPGPADYETAAAIARFRASYPGAGGPRFAAAGAAKRAAPAWRQQPRRAHELERAMANVRARSGGPFGALRPEVRASMLHGWPGVAPHRRPAGGVPAAVDEWGAEWALDDDDGDGDARGEAPRTPARGAGKAIKGGWGTEWD